MKKNRLYMLNFVGMVAVFTNILPSLGYADGNTFFKYRCTLDMLDTPMAVGRNAWARKCGIIQHDDEIFYNAKGQYVTFANMIGPFDENASCIQDAAYIGTCNIAGCYTPTQKIMFSRKYIPISIAGWDRTSTVTAFSESWKLNSNFPLQEEAIGSFIVGEEMNSIFFVTTDTGLQIEVTGQHPMVDDFGNIIPARSLKAGETRLLTTNGPAIVKSFEKRSYKGIVWNIEPKSTRTLANIHIAEGFITGSVRYQNEWAEDTTRLHLRNILDASGV